jgi:hypothetical protein
MTLFGRSCIDRQALRNSDESKPSHYKVARLRTRLARLRHRLRAPANGSAPLPNFPQPTYDMCNVIQPSLYLRDANANRVHRGDASEPAQQRITQDRWFTPGCTLEHMRSALRSLTRWIECSTGRRDRTIAAGNQNEHLQQLP